MAGIYIHIPFCRRACNYCNFYFSTSLGNKERFLQALLTEIKLTTSYLNHEPIETLYIGGGTPSVLTDRDLKHIVEALSHYYNLDEVKEFTLEANPDDLTDKKYLQQLNQLGVNRFSIGVQSFIKEDLLYMNRIHTAQQAIDAVRRVQDSGFSNITIDLIYGTPTMSNEAWQQNLATAFALEVPHISCYALTVEPKTTLENKIRKKALPPVNEEQTATQFQLLLQAMQHNGYEQYEISNFAKNGAYALHNTNYWLSKKYLGLGPSAHSYNGVSRQWNVRNNLAYIHALEKGERAYGQETLSPAQVVNEKIMTGLRTKWGVDLSSFNRKTTYVILQNLKEVNKEHYLLQNAILLLTQEGKLFADAIAAQLFVDESDDVSLHKS